MQRKLLFSIVLVCMSATGCSRQGDDESTIAGTAKATAPVATGIPGSAKRADETRLAVEDGVREANSWQERLSLMTHSERERLEALNRRYFGTLEFSSKEEQRKLMAAGFPMPEEWLAADAKSDAELASLARANSPKGAIFYADRQLDRFVAAKQQLLNEGRYSDLDPSVFNAKVEALVYASNALALTRSPFAAYLYGSVHSTMFGDRESTAAAISVARALGDARAAQFAMDYSQQLRLPGTAPLEFGALSAIETGMWLEVHRYRPL